MEIKFDIARDSNSQQVVKAMLATKCVTISELAKRMNEISDYNYTRFNLAQKLSRNSLKFSEMVLICEILGYKLDINSIK